MANMEAVLEKQLETLCAMEIDELLEKRYQRLLSYGQFAEK